MLVTIATYNQIYLADLDKARLLDYGIPCVIQDQNMVGMNLFYSNAVGGIKLQVPEHFAKHACSVLYGSGTVETEMPMPLLCPECKSNDITPKRYNPVMLMISSLLLLVPFGDTLFSTSVSRYRCNACGHLWDMAGDDE